MNRKPIAENRAGDREPPAAEFAAAAGNAPDDALSGLFTAEPELLLAMLEATGSDCPEQLQRLLSAAADAALSRPRYADLHFYAAWVAYEAQDWTRAQKWLAQALEINPGYRDALILAARVEQAVARPAQALAYLEEALARGADYPDVHLLLGDLYLAGDRRGEAYRAFQRALELNPSLQPARQRLADFANEPRTQGAS